MFQKYGIAIVAGSLLLSTGCVERLIYQQRESQSGSESDSEGRAESSSEGGAEAGQPCEDDADCGPGGECFEGTCVGTGTFRVSLSWEVVSDFDLHVRSPNGTHLFFGNPVGAGGYLDVDDCVATDCRTQDGTHVENIFFEGGDADRGRYKVWVENFDGRRSGDFRVEVSGDVNQEWSGQLPDHAASRSETYEFTW